MFSKLISSFVRILFLGIIFVFLFYPEKLLIKFDFPGFPLSDNKYVRLAKLAFWFLLIIETLRIFYYGVVKSKAKGLIANAVTLIFPLLVTLMLLEIVFMYIPQSHEGVLSKASQIWWEKYWHPVNALGYHDEEIVEQPNKQKILVIGDSFAAGHGLENVEDRFSNIIGKELGSEKYQVFNLGVSGADTRDESKRLQDFPVKPNTIILQYFPNDIEKVGRENGLSLSGTEPYHDLSGITNTIVRHFYLPNFIYWQLPHTGFSSFEKFVETSYTDTTILNSHLRDLQKIVDYRDSTQSKMYAVFIPFLFQMDKSASYTKPVENYLRAKGVEVITLNEGIEKIPTKDRVVGKNDGHASAILNKLIADKILDAMKRNN